MDNVSDSDMKFYINARFYFEKIEKISSIVLFFFKNTELYIAMCIRTSIILETAM